MCRHEDRLLLFPWAGPREMAALLLALTRVELEPEGLGLAVAVRTDRGSQLEAALKALASGPPPDPVELSRLVGFKASEKYDGYLDDELLALAYATDRVDAASLPGLAATLLAGWPCNDLHVDSGRLTKNAGLGHV